jgi:hypothetical protein
MMVSASAQFWPRDGNTNALLPAFDEASGAIRVKPLSKSKPRLSVRLGSLSPAPKLPNDPLLQVSIQKGANS